MIVVISNTRQDFIEWCIKNRISRQEAQKRFCNPMNKHDLYGLDIQQIIDITYYHERLEYHEMVKHHDTREEARRRKIITSEKRKKEK